MAQQLNPVKFLQEVRVELRRVHWPTRDETMKLTLVVIAISIVFGIFIGGVDLLLVKVTELLLKG